MLSFTLLAVLDSILPPGVTFNIFSTSSLTLLTVEFFIIADKCLDIPPTFSSIDISLSFNITIIFVFIYPIWLRASKAIPPVIDPSPIIETTEKSSPFISLAHAIPLPTDIDVLLCPVSNISCSLSHSFGNPLNPLNCLNVLN